MATIDVLNTEFANLFRRAQTPADTTYLTDLAATSRPNNFTSVATATQNLVRQAVGTAEVGVLTYGFFTGVALRTSGLDYLLSPTGPNPSNLNSAYYAQFNTENRYINFAKNLGAVGEGAAAFQANYGALTLAQTAGKAYAAIFGTALSADAAQALVSASVSDGRGGAFTRGDYLASYGGDGLNGLGTKAALVGWLLSQAANSQSGPYAQAAVAYLQDLAPDGQAQFGANLLAAYGPGGDYAAGGRLDPGLPGETFTITRLQSVILFQGNGPQPVRAALAAFATGGNDVVTSTTGLAPANAESFGYVTGVQLGGGNDSLTVTGDFASGPIFAEAGNDRINIAAFNGAIYTGTGYDIVTLGSFSSLTAPDGFGRTSTPSIEDFARGQDQLIFTDAVGPGRLSTVDVRGAASFSAALATVAGVTAANANTVFEYGGSTYVFHQNGDAAVNLGAALGSDGLIKLAGVTGLTLDARDGRAFDTHFGS